MGKNAQLGAAEPGGIDNAGMHELIQNNHIVGAYQCTDSPQGGRVACREAQRGFRPFEGSQSLLELLVRLERAADQARSAATRTVTFDRTNSGLFELRVV